MENNNTIKTKYYAVLYFKRCENGDVAIKPFAVHRARGNTFSGNSCKKCIIIPDKEWEDKGLDIVLRLLCMAPHTENDTFDDWQTAESLEVFGNNIKKVYAAARTWINHSQNQLPTPGKISIYPSWSPYLSGEVYSFIKIPTQERFLEEMDRLMRFSNNVI